MMNASNEKRPVLRFIVAALILLVAGAEIAIALQLVGLIDLLGVELFLTSCFGGVLWRFRVAANIIKAAATNRFIRQLDSTFAESARR
jgi:type IV secretory pathway TrbD component